LERSQSRPDLEHGLARLDAGAAHDGPDGVGVHHEVLPALLRGADAGGLGALTDVASSQQQPRARRVGAVHAATASGQPYTSCVVVRIVRPACSRTVPVTSAIVAMVCGIR